MEIPGIKGKSIQNLPKVSGKQAPKKSADSGSSTTGTQGSENIALSAKAKGVQLAHEVVKNTPDIRVDKVERIKQQIADGSFHVDSRDLAEKILKDVITESKFLG